MKLNLLLRGEKKITFHSMYKRQTNWSLIFRRTPHVHSDLVINDETVERVAEYKYLGTIIDCKLNCEANVNAIYKT